MERGSIRTEEITIRNGNGFLPGGMDPVILNPEMKTTDYTESTDTEEVNKEGLNIQQMSGACLTIH